MRANEFLSEDDGPVKLKLNNNNAAKAFIERVYAKYPHTMQNNHVMVWGSGDDQQFAMFELTPSFSKRGAVEVKWFQAYPLRQGVGSRAMKELQALAREDDIALTLFPWDKGQVSQSKLTKFYKGQGFTPTVKGGKAMKWEPISERKQYPLEDFEGLKFRIVADSGQLFVNALDSTGNNELGHVTFNNDNGKDLDPQDLFVKEKFQGQGIAKIMYDFVKSKGYKIQRSWDQTDAGAGFWNKHKGEDVRVWEQKQVDEAELDPTGWGATPQGTDIDYFGLKVKMRPSTFLKLSHPLNSSEQNYDVEKHMQGGGKIAYPFLEVKDPVEWEDGDFSQVGKVVNHEGRNRMTHWIKMKGDEPIQVNIFLRGANRRRYVTDDMIQALSQGLISQTGQLVKNPFDANTALEEAGEQGNRWTGAEEYRHLVELDLEEGWKEKAAAGALALGALGAHGDAEAKYKETWIQPRQQAAHATMAPAAKFDSTQIKAKAPIAKAPIAKSPIAKAPIAKAPIAKAPIAKAPVGSTNVDPTAMNILSLHNPEAEEVLHRTAKAAGLKGTELAQFMAQTRHESADFSRMKEMGGDKYFNKLYDPKTSPRTAKILGNTKIGDGIRYHGRGFIQITGRDNYRMAGDALRLPLEQHPELASKPAIAAKIAVWYWKTRVKPFVQNFADTAAVTKKINPAMRGLQDRHEYFKDYKNII